MTMIPGPTAWAVERSVIPLFGRAIAAQVLALLGIAAALLRLPWGLGWGLFAAAIAFFLWFILGFLKVNKIALKEREAGYTTRNGVELDLEQRHPVTGAVIRGAGEPRISKQEFAALLG